MSKNIEICSIELMTWETTIIRTSTWKAKWRIWDLSMSMKRSLWWALTLKLLIKLPKTFSILTMSSFAHWNLFKYQKNMDSTIIVSIEANTNTLKKLMNPLKISENWQNGCFLLSKSSFWEHYPTNWLREVLTISINKMLKS